MLRAAQQAGPLQGCSPSLGATTSLNVAVGLLEAGWGGTVLAAGQEAAGRRHTPCMPAWLMGVGRRAACRHAELAGLPDAAGSSNGWKSSRVELALA